MLHRYIVQRLAAFNLAGLALFVWALYLGYPQMIDAGDSTHIVWVEAGLFVVGLVSLFRQAWRLRRESRAGVYSSAVPAAFLERIVHLSDIGSWLVILGLTGTVIGLAMTMGGIDVNAIGTPEGARGVISHLLDHMSVAFNTTIVGGILGLWSEVNHRMLRTASVVLFAEGSED